MKAATPTTLQIESILADCLQDPLPSGPRDAALFALMWCARLNIAEAVRYNTEGALRIAAQNGGVWEQAIETYLRIRPMVAGPLLLTIDRRCQMTSQPMRTTTAAEVIRRRAAAARVGYVTPQDLLRGAVEAARCDQPGNAGAALQPAK